MVVYMCVSVLESGLRKTCRHQKKRSEASAAAFRLLIEAVCICAP